MGELERYKAALELAMQKIQRLYESSLTSGRERPGIKAVQAEVHAILNPPPEMETVEVVGWRHKSFGDYTEDSTIAGMWGADAIPLTGTFQRPKPVKVERSVSVEGAVDKIGMCNRKTGGCEYQAEFAARPECHGKSGVLTFTWTE